jgi:hypothetical protein
VDWKCAASGQDDAVKVKRIGFVPCWGRERGEFGTRPSTADHELACEAVVRDAKYERAGERTYKNVSLLPPLCSARHHFAMIPVTCRSWTRAQAKKKTHVRWTV